MSYEIFSGRFIMQWNFGLHNDLIMAKKMTFFRIFFSLAHLHIEAQLFCFYQNFISSAVQRNHGDGTRKKALHQRRRRTDERTTNDELH